MSKKKKKKHGAIAQTITTITGRTDGKGPVKIEITGGAEPDVVMKIGKVGGQIIGTQVVRGDQINYFH